MNWLHPEVNKDWVPMTQIQQVDEAIIGSTKMPIIIYKHSTRCGLSMMAQHRLEEGWENLGPYVKLYFLDLIQYRDISTAVAERFGVRHQSPQVLLIHNGRCVYHSSHHAISADAIRQAIDELETLP